MCNTVNPRIFSPLGAYLFFIFFDGGLFEGGGLKRGGGLKNYCRHLEDGGGPIRGFTVFSKICVLSSFGQN